MPSAAIVAPGPMWYCAFKPGWTILAHANDRGVHGVSLVRSSLAQGPPGIADCGGERRI